MIYSRVQYAGSSWGSAGTGDDPVMNCNFYGAGVMGRNVPKPAKEALRRP